MYLIQSDVLDCYIPGHKCALGVHLTECGTYNGIRYLYLMYLPTLERLRQSDQRTDRVGPVAGAAAPAARRPRHGAHTYTALPAPTSHFRLPLVASSLDLRVAPPLSSDSSPSPSLFSDAHAGANRCCLFAQGPWFGAPTPRDLVPGAWPRWSSFECGFVRVSVCVSEFVCGWSC